MRYRTLNKNWQFNRVYGRGKSYVHPHCVLYVAKNRVGYTRIGLTATKKVGHAVQRNRFYYLLSIIYYLYKKDFTYALPHLK